MVIKDRLDKVKSRLDQYYEAELNILSGQEYKIGSRSLKRADLGEIRKSISALEKQYNELEFQLNAGGKRRSLRIVPRDF